MTPVEFAKDLKIVLEARDGQALHTSRERAMAASRLMVAYQTCAEEIGRLQLRIAELEKAK